MSMGYSFGGLAGGKYGYGSKLLIVLFILLIIGGAFYAGRRSSRSGECCDSGYDYYNSYERDTRYDPYSFYDIYGNDTPYGAYGHYNRGRRGLII